MVHLPAGASCDYLVRALAMLADRLATEPVAGKLQIVEPDRLRWYRPEED